MYTNALQERVERKDYTGNIVRERLNGQRLHEQIVQSIDVQKILYWRMLYAKALDMEIL